VLNLGTSQNPSYFPAEVCILLPGQNVKRRLSPQETQIMIKFACRNPMENGRSITDDGTKTLGLRPSVNTTLVCDYSSLLNSTKLTVSAAGQVRT
jgi:eukaryotic translation initiation factor 2C